MTRIVPMPELGGTGDPPTGTDRDRLLPAKAG